MCTHSNSYTLNGPVVDFASQASLDKHALTRKDPRFCCTVCGSGLPSNINWITTVIHTQILKFGAGTPGVSGYAKINRNIMGITKYIL